ncbi:MAG TPA: hypothetical protein DCW90_00905 [Lachnospiraceae bacterium]|nr:hypothetical protein [Lachnospiraceae bacterium]
MTELNVNFEDLVHMDLEEGKKIVSHFNNEDYWEELGAKINDTEYGLDIIDEGDWIDEGKYQYKDVTGVLSEIAEDGSVTKYDIAVTQYITRSGSYFSEYYYEYEPLDVRQLVQKVIPQQIIPERTVVTFKEE